MSICRKCGNELNNDNWYKSDQKRNNRVCSKCRKSSAIKNKHKLDGGAPMGENKQCPLYMGSHIAETVLSMVFKNVERMSTNNPGYDFICNHGKKIDVKSSCQQIKTKHTLPIWYFNIFKNTTADYFLCIAFDNREDLNPMHLWLIPSDVINHLNGITISTKNVSKWDEYTININKTIKCCDSMKNI